MVDRISLILLRTWYLVKRAGRNIIALRLYHNYSKESKMSARFCIGGIFDPPQHQAATHALEHALVSNGVPQQLVYELVENGILSVPSTAATAIAKLQPVMPLSSFISHILPRKLASTPQYEKWGSAAQHDKELEYIAEHAMAEAKYLEEKRLANKEVDFWNEQVRAVQSKQPVLCEIALQRCDTEMATKISTSAEYNSTDPAKSLRLNLGLLIAEIFRLASISNRGLSALDVCNALLYKIIEDDTPIEAAVNKLEITYKLYVKLLKNDGKVPSTGKEEELIRHFITEAYKNKTDHTFIRLNELLKRDPSPIQIPTTFTALAALLNQCTVDVMTGKCQTLSIKQAILSDVRGTYATVTTPATPEVGAKGDKPKTPRLKPAATTSTDPCERSAMAFAKTLTYCTTNAGTTEAYCPRLRNDKPCRYNHDVTSAKNFISTLGNKTSAAVTNQTTNPYNPIPHDIPYAGRVSMIGATPASDQLLPWYPPHTILLDEGSNVHCANDALMDASTLRNIPEKYNGTIGGWILTNKSGIMRDTGLQCDYTPRSPFNIISKTVIEHDPNWKLTEVNNHDGKRYILMRHDGRHMIFVPVNGVYIYIMESIPHSHPIQPISAASINLPKQYIDNIAHLTFSSAEKHGLLRIYPLLESGLSYSELETLIRTKHITNVTLNDIANAKLALGYDRAWLGGNDKLNQLSIPIPPIPHHVQLKDITVTFDIGFLFNFNHLIGIGGNICDVISLDAANANVTKRNVKTMIQRFHAAGYRVAAFAVDMGPQFEPKLSEHLNRLVETLGQLGIRQDPVYTGEHGATAEVMIRELKYKLRSLIIRHGRKVPNTTNTYMIRHDLIKHAIAYVVQRYLMTIRKGHTTSASEAITGIMPSYEDFSLPFLTPVEISDTSKLKQRNNSTMALTHTCLSLEPIGDGRGGYYFYNINTKAIIKRAHGSYTILTRLDESIYQAYMNYINDAKENTPWDISQIESTIDVDELGSTVFTRATRYQPVHDVLQPTTTPAPGVAHIPINLDNEDTGVVTTPDMETGITTTPATSNNVNTETGVVPTPVITAINTPEIDHTISKAGRRRQHRRNQSSTNTSTNSTASNTNTRPRNTRSSNIPAISSAFAIACATVFITAATVRAKTQEEAIYNELRNILYMQTLYPCHYSDIDDKRKLVGCGMIHTQKFDELNDGALLGDKARLVGYGHNYTFNLDTLESSSPTPRYEHIVSLMLHCHRKGYIFKTGDVKNAYLQAPLPANSHYIRIDKKYVDVLCQIDPSWQPYVTNKGHAYAEVKRALYGFTEAGKLWHETVTSALKDIGCVANPRDPCVFSYHDKITGDNAHIVVYVDDFMFCGSTENVLTTITSQLTTRFGDIKLESGPKLQYLNMVIDASDPKKLIFDMQRYKQNMTNDMVLPTNVILPGDSQFDIIDHASPTLNDEAKTFFHKKTAQLLYLANHLHGEISYYVNKLCQRVQAPTESDMQKLMQILGYIKMSINDKLELDASHFDDPKIYIDAAYATNTDFKSQSGLVMLFGRGSFVCRSHKQHINTKSSTESELVALSDMASTALGVIYFLQECGVTFNSVTIYQDNKSTMKMLHKGYPDGKYSRHINIRSYWLKDLVQRKELQIIYISTNDMVADIMTKATPGRIFRRFRNLILGRIEEIDASDELKQFKLDSIQIAKDNLIEGL